MSVLRCLRAGLSEMGLGDAPKANPILDILWDERGDEEGATNAGGEPPSRCCTYDARNTTKRGNGAVPKEGRRDGQ